MKSKRTEMTKTTLRVPKQLLDACKHRAIDEGRNLQEIVADALEAYMKTKIKSVKGDKK
ncbi:MAG: CopG family transcriptional regulator [Nitrospina sp.]|jgi:predicted DNA binding CopG/RHH family protein|nr:CopG family transcriptional regulator [Nitrospina sp.]